MVPHENEKQGRRKTSKRLTHISAIRIAELLKDNAQALTNGALSISDAVQLIERQLQIAVGRNSVERIASELNMQLPDARPSRRSSLMAVAGAVECLYRKLGEPIPDGLREVVASEASCRPTPQEY